MRRFVPPLIAAVVLLLGASSVALAQKASDPEAAFKEINTWFSDQLKKAREENKPVDIASIRKDQVAKAKAALEGIDIAKEEPAKCYAWGQLYQMAGMNKEMLAAAQRFISSNPDPARLYPAQQMALNGMQAEGDAAGMVKMITEMKPANSSMAASLAMMTAARYYETVADKLGSKAAFDLLDRVEKSVDFDEVRKEDAKRADEAKARNPQALVSSQADSVIYYLGDARASLFKRDGKNAEALAALEAAKAKLPSDSRMAKTLDGKLRLAKLPGSPAPDVKSERCYGSYSSLEALKGKVVMLDFTAHW